VKDGFSRYRRQFLLDLPVPRVEAFMGRQIIAAIGAGNHQEATRLASTLFNVDADDVGAAAAYLLSDDAKNVTGTTLYVDSGYHAMGM
jgi:enoyl-[acyl-carrier-protein] reductase (NADH)